MKIHDQGFKPQAGDVFWAAMFKYGEKEPSVFPVSFKGDAPYLELVQPPGNFCSEWWLVARCEVPRVEVVDNYNEAMAIKLVPQAEPAGVV